MVGVVRRPGRRGGGSGGGGEVFARPPGEVAAGASRRTVHRRRVPCDVGDHAGAHDVVAQLGHVHEHVLRRSRLHDLLELTGDRRGRHRVRGLLAQVATEVGQVVVHAVLPAPAIGREAAHVTVVVVGPHDDHVVRQPERLRIAAVQVQHLRVHREVEDRRVAGRQGVAHHAGLEADHLTEHARLVVVCGPLGPGIGAIRRVPQSHRADHVPVMVLRDAAAPEGQQAVAVREPVVVGSHAALRGEVERGQAERVGHEDVVVVRRIVEAPVARELLHLEAAMHPHVRRHHVHPQPQRGLEVAPIPGERYVAGLERVAAGVERAGQDVFIVVEEPAIPERGRSLSEPGCLEHEGFVVLRHVPGPEVKGIHTQALRKRVRRERGAARVRPDQPDRGGCGDHPVGLPLGAERGHLDGARERAVPDGDQPDARLAGAGRRHDGRAVAADGLDVARQEGGRLAYVQVLRGAHHDLHAAPARREHHVSGRDGARPDPGPAHRRGPQVGLRGAPRRNERARDQHGNDCSASAHGIDPLIGGVHGEAAQLDITCARAGSLSRVLLDTTLFPVSSSNEQTSDQGLMLLGLPLLAAVTLASQSPNSRPQGHPADPPLPPTTVNPSGVKLDAQIYNDGNEDFAWDAVWDVATRRDSLGWTAEFRIPLSQLRYGRQRQHTFGLTIDRDLYRYSQRVSWPLFRQSKAGFVSQFGEVPGFDDLEAPRRLEAAPYVVTKNVSEFTPTGIGRTQDVALGGDLKYRVASNLTVDATLNPDFGQVEADPGVLNLSAFETFFPEQRPFFVAGRGLFQFDVNCNDVNCSSEGLVYSRRIGRAPELAGTYSDTTSPAFTRILGAGKLTGRLPSGLTIGVLDAVTQHVTGVGRATIAPTSNYGVMRLRQDLRAGRTRVVGIITAVDRDNDAFTSPYLRGSAYVGATDFRHRFPGGKWEINGSLDLSHVSGSAQVIAATQRDAVHYYQRPDAGLGVDSTRTSLSGDAEELQFSKVSGKVIGQTSYQRRSPGFEINDLGYLQRADQQSWSTWVGFFDRKRRALTQRFQWNFNWWQYWTTAGLPEERAFNTNTHTTFNNTWSFHTGFTLGQLGETYCYSCARGGPAVRENSYLAPWLGINGDDPKANVPYFWLNYSRSDGGRSNNISLSPDIDFKLASRITASLSPSYSRSRDDVQPLGPTTDTSNVTHYLFGHLEQKQLALTMRFTYPFTASMSLPVYAQPFISKGTFSNVRELSTTPRATDYASRYQAYGDTAYTNNIGGFNFKQFRSNVVYRWEYRPGSTLFVVWSQGRRGSAGVEGERSFGGDMNDLFNLRPDNSFLVKLSYWIHR